MKTLEKIASMNANNIEKKQMDELFGGVGSQECTYTLKTVTCTPEGNKMDPDDDPSVPESCVGVNVQVEDY